MILEGVKIFQGDCLEVLRQFPEESISCVVSSPPYWAQRDYGVEGQLGLEPTIEEYVTRLVNVFSGVRRVLRSDATVWLNLGDSFFSSTKGTGGPSAKQDSNVGSRFTPRKLDDVEGLKPKDLIGMPWRVALALQADGWWLRSDIIYSKRNPMPESVNDRPTRAHEYVFLLTKSAKYYYAADAVREAFADARMGNPKGGGQYMRQLYPDQPHAQSGIKKGVWTRGLDLGGRNMRDVWTIAARPHKGAGHFAVFPEALVEPCVLAGCPEGGIVCDPFCGSGTTGVVALRLGRKFIGIDLSPKYVRLAEERIKASQEGRMRCR